MTPDVRLIVITDRALAGPRSIVDIVTLATQAGAPAIQLRDKRATARELAETTRALLPIVRAHGARLFVNDRADVALATGADGVHLGPDDVPVAAVRRFAPPGFLIGCSTDSPEQARSAHADGADYIGCGAVFGTATKPEVGDEQIGPDGLDRVAGSVPIPVVAIGGISVDNVDLVAHTRAAGVAVVSAVMRAPDPGDVVRRLLAAFQRPAA